MTSSRALRLYPTEADITAAVLDYLAIVGTWSLKVHGHLGQRAGVPDVLACLRGRFVAIEIKRPGGKLSAEQRRELVAVTAAGGIALVVTDVDQVITAAVAMGARELSNA